MEIQKKEINAIGTKFYIKQDEKEVGRAYLYILSNDLHKKPFGLMEDVYVDESVRNKGLGSDLVKKVIEEARIKGCYKLICTSRYEKPKVHELYVSLGFRNQGKEFRMNF
jgi:GNAT superfamily N-acetyltransferase